MCPCTKKECENFPHVVLTADAEWDPFIIDGEEMGNKEWYNAI